MLILKKIPRCIFLTFLLSFSLQECCCMTIVDTKSRKVLRKLMKKTGHSDANRESDYSKPVSDPLSSFYADIGTKCIFDLYQKISWVYYYGDDPECDEEIAAEKRLRTAANSSEFKDICYNPNKILGCDRQTERCGCAAGLRWKNEQAFTEEDGECRFGDDGDCYDDKEEESIYWAKCLKSLKCKAVGRDADNNIIKRCLPRDIQSDLMPTQRNGNNASSVFSESRLFLTLLVVFCWIIRMQ